MTVSYDFTASLTGDQPNLERALEEIRKSDDMDLSEHGILVQENSITIVGGMLCPYSAVRDMENFFKQLTETHHITIHVDETIDGSQSDEFYGPDAFMVQSEWAMKNIRAMLPYLEPQHRQQLLEELAR